MRNDFNKVLTERPRRGHKRKHKEVRKAYNSELKAGYDNEEDGPLGGTEGMKKPYGRNGVDRKGNTDLWSAIRRFMLSRVGRKWDDVWSEVNRDLRESDDMRAHWRVHCKIEVDEKVSVAPNGKLWRIAGRRRLFDLRKGEWPLEGIPGCNKRFYVDPRDGILRKTPETVWPKRHREIEQPEYGWDVGFGVTIKLIEGIWYDVTYTARLESYRVAVYDYNVKVIWPAPRPVLRYDTQLRTVYDYVKRQLSTKELKKYGVKNEN